MLRSLLLLTLVVPSAAFAAEIKSDSEGWSVKVPAAWKHGETAGRYVLGSDTEAGLIVAWFAQGVTWEQMKQSASDGINEQGLVMSPMGEAVASKVKAGRTLSVTLSGMGSDGVEIRGYAIGILAPNGSLGLLGLTTPDKFANLKKRVDAMAESVDFFKPKVGAGVAMLQGPICSYSGGNIASTTRRFNFDGKGNVTFGAETIAGSDLGVNGSDGSWSAVMGNQHDASSRGTYSVVGDRVVVRINDNTYDCRVHFRQQNGAITELKCGSQLWGRGLCD